LDCLLKHAQRAPINRMSREFPGLCLNLSCDSLPITRRGLLPCRTAPCLNAFLQVLLPCSPLMHLFAQLSWHTLSTQRPVYAFLVQIAFRFFATNNTMPCINERSHSNGTAPHGDSTFPPIDTFAYAEPLLRRFERSRATSSSPDPIPTLALLSILFSCSCMKSASGQPSPELLGILKIRP